MSIPAWLGVKVSLQSTALGTEKSITAITKANPAVVTSTAHGFTNGQFVVIKTDTMVQLNKRVFRVANVSANSFELDGIDSTNFDAYTGTAGTAQLATLGTSFSTLTNVSASGGEATDMDLTTIHDTVAKVRPGLVSASKFTFQSHYDLASPALQLAKQYSDEQKEVAIAFTFADGAKALIFGYISAPLLPNGSQGQVVTTPVTISASSSLTNLAI